MWKRKTRTGLASGYVRTPPENKSYFIIIKNLSPSHQATGHSASHIKRPSTRHLASNTCHSASYHRQKFSHCQPNHCHVQSPQSLPAQSLPTQSPQSLPTQSPPSTVTAKFSLCPRPCLRQKLCWQQKLCCRQRPCRLLPT